MNLPREIRFKKENIIVVGIIPALDQEPGSLNSFLGPLVKELKTLWRGINIKTAHQSVLGEVCREALLCCSSDLPANRKLCGFVGHSATHGCTKGYNKFPLVENGYNSKGKKTQIRLQWI